MSNPLLTISLFYIRTKKACVKHTYTASVYPNGATTMGDELDDLLAHMRDHKQKAYLTFATYQKNHTKDDLLQMSAIMLEYPWSSREQLLQNLAGLPYAHYVVDTIADFSPTSECRLLVAFPLDRPITDPKQYTRIASLLWNAIGIDAHTKGDISGTFLFAPYIARPSVRYFDAEGVFIDPDTFVDEHRGTWVNARESEPAKPEPQPSDDGLFLFFDKA